jgi:hypothetical protein
MSELFVLEASTRIFALCHGSADDCSDDVSRCSSYPVEYLCAKIYASRRASPHPENQSDGWSICGVPEVSGCEGSSNISQYWLTTAGLVRRDRSPITASACLAGSADSELERPDARVVFGNSADVVQSCASPS